MAAVNRTINILGLADAIEDILKQRDRLFGAGKGLLFVLISSALGMVFQGESYKNTCLSVVVGICMTAVDPRIHSRLLKLEASKREIPLAISNFLDQIFLNELAFCALCLLIATMINMCVVPVVWIVTGVLGISFLSKIFTETLVTASTQDLLLHLGILLPLICCLRNFGKSKVVMYSVFFSLSGSTILWISLEAILSSDLGFDRVCRAFFKNELGCVLWAPQLYPFLLLVVAGVFSQIKINSLLAGRGRQHLVSVVIKRGENKVIEV